VVHRPNGPWHEQAGGPNRLRTQGLTPRSGRATFARRSLFETSWPSGTTRGPLDRPRFLKQWGVILFIVPLIASCLRSYWDWLDQDILHHHFPPVINPSASRSKQYYVEQDITGHPTHMLIIHLGKTREPRSSRARATSPQSSPRPSRRPTAHHHGQPCTHKPAWHRDQAPVPHLNSQASPPSDPQ
jgi:hypothetical protein